jgi:hypothetical protein
MNVDWCKEVENAIGVMQVEMDISGLIALVLEGARSATWWQAQCQGHDALITELRNRITWLESQIQRAIDPVVVDGGTEESLTNGNEVVR